MKIIAIKYATVDFVGDLESPMLLAWFTAR
jgi:hypothetical protein